MLRFCMQCTKLYSNIYVSDISFADDCNEDTDDLVEFPYSDFCYRIEFLDVGVQYADAKKLCESETGRMLVEVYTEDIKDRLQYELQLKFESSITDKKINGFWIGLVRGHWLWHDGKDL